MHLFPLENVQLFSWRCLACLCCQARLGASRGERFWLACLRKLWLAGASAETLEQANQNTMSYSFLWIKDLLEELNVPLIKALRAYLVLRQNLPRRHTKVTT